MKQQLFTVLFCFAAAIASAGSSTGGEDSRENGRRLTSSFTIDAFDSVVFDISQSSIALNQVSFPVYIFSDDTINALDFSLRFDESNFTLDTIINLSSHLQPVYNISMGTLYFTSYSLQKIENDTPLVAIRFNMLGHYLCSSDLDSILVYLNGDPCTSHVVECITDNIPDVIQTENAVTVFPNPVKGMLKIETKEEATVQLLDAKSIQVLLQTSVHANREQHISITDLAAGLYFVKVFNKNFVSVKKIVVEISD
jgi:hypothetical protein